VLAHFIGSYLGGEGGRKWIYGIGYQVGIMVTQFSFIHNAIIKGFPKDGRWWVLGQIIPLGVRCMSSGCQLWLIM